MTQAVAMPILAVKSGAGLPCKECTYCGLLVSKETRYAYNTIAMLVKDVTKAVQ